MTNSINTNIAAYYAQQNITTASNQATASVARLSSGNAIVEASDNVAALATGTSLATQVNALKTAQQNVSQGSSLLQVADGALAQVQSILQQQQSIALQAASGSLTDTDRSFLNQQFQGLSQEINSLAGSTTFNGLNLLDGSLSGNAAIATNTEDNASTAAQATAGDFLTVTAVPVDGDTVTINGVTVTFTTSAYGTAGAAGKVVIGADVPSTMANLATFLNSSADPQFANLQFVASASGLSATYTGGKLAGQLNLTASTNFATAGDASITSANLSIAAGGANGLGANTYSALGTVSGSLLNTPDATTTNTGSAVDLSDVLDNAAFSGNFNSIGSFTGSYNGTAGNASFSFTAGGITYSTSDTTLTGATPTALTFTGADQYGNAAGGSFTVTIAGSAVTAVASQADATNIANEINQGLSGVAVYQNRTVSSFQNGNIATVNGVQVANLSGMSVNLHASDYTNPTISSVTVTAPTNGSPDAKIQVVINGDTYTSASGIGNQIAENTVIGLQDESNPANTLSIVTGNSVIASSTTTALDLSSQANANAFQAALQQAFGLNGNTSGLTFQTGADSGDTLSVKIGGATTNNLFSGQTLDVSTQTDANAANTALTTAINTVTALRSNVGALESQFNFASAAIQSGQQNEDSARSSLLDTDIAAESTNYANEQVKLQAGISVLAQANQSLQALLKLIG